MSESDKKPPYRFMTVHEFQFSDAKDTRPFCIGRTVAEVIPTIRGAIVINDAFPTLVAAANKFPPPDRGTVLVIGNLISFDAVAAMTVLERRWFALNMGDRRLITSLERSHLGFLDAMAYAARRDRTNALTRACEDRRIALPQKVQLVRDFIETGSWETAEQLLGHNTPNQGEEERS